MSRYPFFLSFLVKQAGWGGGGVHDLLGRESSCRGLVPPELVLVVLHKPSGCDKIQFTQCQLAWSHLILWEVEYLSTVRNFGRMKIDIALRMGAMKYSYTPIMYCQGTIGMRDNAGKI